MLLLGALALLAAADASAEDKTIQSCPEGWEIGQTDGWEIGSKEGWEIGSTCKDADGVIWTYDGYTWSDPAGYTWSHPAGYTW